MSHSVDVLAFGPHPDDVEIFCGGAMIRFAELGYKTGVVDLSRGELASRGTPEQRAREAEAASQILGLTMRENLGLPDGFLNAASTEQLEAAVEALRRHRPELVLIPWLEERHPDHSAAGALLTRAVFMSGLKNYETGRLDRFAVKQVLYYQMRFRMTPTFVMDTSSAGQRKREAIACYASQVAPRSEETPTLIGSAYAIDAIETRDRYYGTMIGTASGEPLRAPNTLGVKDPLAHFRQNPFFEAHAFERLR